MGSAGAAPRQQSGSSSLKSRREDEGESEGDDDMGDSLRVADGDEAD